MLLWIFAVGDFLLELMQSLTGTKKLFDLFNLIINVMKFNAVYLKEEAVSGIIKWVDLMNHLAIGYLSFVLNCKSCSTWFSNKFCNSFKSFLGNRNKFCYIRAFCIETYYWCIMNGEMTGSRLPWSTILIILGMYRIQLFFIILSYSVGMQPVLPLFSDLGTLALCTEVVA